jgi:hypothetical protein
MENCPFNRNLVVAPLSLLAYRTETNAIPWQSQGKTPFAPGDMSPVGLEYHDWILRKTLHFR